jgi:hypothetical protein
MVGNIVFSVKEEETATIFTSPKATNLKQLVERDMSPVDDAQISTLFFAVFRQMMISRQIFGQLTRTIFKCFLCSCGGAKDVKISTMTAVAVGENTLQGEKIRYKSSRVMRCD